jgi:hypothetical protein
MNIHQERAQKVCYDMVDMAGVFGALGAQGEWAT